MRLVLSTTIYDHMYIGETEKRKREKERKKEREKERKREREKGRRGESPTPMNPLFGTKV